MGGMTGTLSNDEKLALDGDIIVFLLMRGDIIGVDCCLAGRFLGGRNGCFDTTITVAVVSSSAGGIGILSSALMLTGSLSQSSSSSLSLAFVTTASAGGGC